MGSVQALLNRDEMVVNERLSAVCSECAAKVFPKVRVADVLRVHKSGIESYEYSYALKAHFDFVVADEDFNPLFAVEYDGPSHTKPVQIARDRIKNGLCAKFEFPLLRVNSNWLARQERGMDVLSWIVETWFNSKAFDEAQEKGVVPYEEMFDPTFIVSAGDRDKFPYWLSLPVQNEVKRWNSRGICFQPVMSYAVGEDDDGNIHGMGFLLITESAGVIGVTGMRAQRFFCNLSDLVFQLSTIETHTAAVAVLSGKARAISAAEIERRVGRFTSRYRLTQSCWFGSRIDFS